MTLRNEILKALQKLRVEIAGRYDDHSRWSPSDLATDLAHELEPLYERKPPRGPCGMRYHADDCECGGMGGDR